MMATAVQDSGSRSGNRKTDGVQPTRTRRAVFGLLIGLLAGFVCWLVHRPVWGTPERLAQLPPPQAMLLMGSSDFVQVLVPARAVLNGTDPFVNLYPGYVPYPLTAALVGIPVVGLSPSVGGALVMGVSVALLTYLLLAQGHFWRLWLFASLPFESALASLQLVPLVMALALAGWAPLALLLKPQNALPLFFTYRARCWSFVAAAVVLGGSLWLIPSWPFRWWALLGAYEGVAPVVVFPGALVFLALLCWEKPAARLLVLLACCPQRDWYDALSLWLIPSTRRGMAILTAASWLAFPFTLLPAIFPGLVWAHWHPLLRLGGCYLPSLGVLLWEERATVAPRVGAIKRAVAGFVGSR